MSQWVGMAIIWRHISSQVWWLKLGQSARIPKHTLFMWLELPRGMFASGKSDFLQGGQRAPNANVPVSKVKAIMHCMT